MGPSAVLALAALLVFLMVFPAAGQEAAGTLPVLGIDPLTRGTVVENHDCALQHWLERGLAGVVVLHIDTHDDLRPVDERRMAKLRELRDRRAFSAMAPSGCGGKTGLFNEGNFLRAAAGLGVVKEVVWVMPFTFLGEPDARERLQRYLIRAGFPESDAATFRLVDGWFRGSLGDVPVTVCSQERLPPLAEPVLLSIDADFFPFAASYRGLTPLAEIRRLFEALREARYAVRDAVVAYSVQGGFLPVRLRWVGDVVVEVLRDPAIARESRPPARWLDLQTVEVVRAKAAPENEGMLALAFGFLEAQPHDPALLLYAAEASARHGSGDAALAYAEEACRVDRGYCAGLPEIGLQMLERGDVEASRRFFQAADRVQPGMAFGQLERGMALLAVGLASEALEVFAGVRTREGAFPIGFLIGELHLAAGDPAAARRSFDEALAAMEADRQAGVPNGVVAEAIRRAGAFYRTEGLARQAQAIEDDPRSRWSYDGQAP